MKELSRQWRAIDPCVDLQIQQAKDTCLSSKRFSTLSTTELPGSRFRNLFQVKAPLIPCFARWLLIITDNGNEIIGTEISFAGSPSTRPENSNSSLSGLFRPTSESDGVHKSRNPHIQRDIFSREDNLGPPRYENEISEYWNHWAK